MRLKNTDKWTLRDIYDQLGCPLEIPCGERYPRRRRPKRMPDYLVEPTTFEFLAPDFVSEAVVVMDMGEGLVDVLPGRTQRSQPGDRGHYRSPEQIVGGTASKESAIWTLGCVIFFLRS